jgi:hypothetical protein
MRGRRPGKDEIFYKNNFQGGSFRGREGRGRDRDARERGIGSYDTKKKKAMKAVTKDIIFVKRDGILRKIISLRESLNVTIANDGDI